MSRLHKILQQRMVFLDGAFGTELQKRGLSQGDIPELWNVTHSGIITEIHESYIEAGSDIINTNTFGGNRLKLQELGLADRIIELNEAAVKNARKAAGKDVLIAGSIGPTGVFLAPFGPLSFEEMYAVYKEQVEILVNSGVDIINFETMVDIGELRAAVLAAFDVCKLPVFASLTFDQNGRTLTGSDAVTSFNILQGLGVEFVGTNCGMGPKDMFNVLKGIREHVDTGLVIQANAGLPIIQNGKTVFSMQEEEYVEHVKHLLELGVSVLGGCCGTTPEFIKSLTKNFKGKKPVDFIKPKDVIRLSSTSKTVSAGEGERFLSIGEKINPSASKKLRLEIQSGSLSYVKELAKKQQDCGAGALDVNMGTSGIDEKEMIVRAVKELTALVNTPLCVDSTRSDAVEEAVKVYPGRALINSITGEKEKIDSILPIMKRYGAYAILLPLDEKGIPETLEARKEIIVRILKAAEKAGVPKNRFIVDCLVMTISAAQPLVKLSLDTVRMVKEEFGLPTTAGLSNVSFGLPARSIINGNFLAMLIAYGLDSAIVNAENDIIRAAISSAEIVTGRDKNASAFIEKYRDAGSLVLAHQDTLGENIAGTHTGNNTQSPDESGKYDPLFYAILIGDSENIVELIKSHLNSGKKPLETVNSFMIPAIVEVGKRYDRRDYFLPQLIMSAETMKKGFQYLEPMLKEDAHSSLGKILLATVKGDVHDIGKNIVAIMLSNNGFNVIDMGKDVSSDEILKKAITEKADVIGLSALMTTTMEEMGRFMKLLEREGLKIPVMIGGAVVNDDYAKSIGAHYSKDAVQAVEVAKSLITRN